MIPIDMIDTKKHSINHKPIKHVTQTMSVDKHLICFQAHSLGHNTPTQKTIMTKDHKVLYRGAMVSAHRFLGMSKNITKVKYSGELLYNILLAEHEIMDVNNLQCETLHPENIIAQLYNNNYPEEYKNNIIFSMNDAIQKKDFVTYKQLVETAFKNDNNNNNNNRFGLKTIL